MYQPYSYNEKTPPNLVGSYHFPDQCYRILEFTDCVQVDMGYHSWINGETFLDDSLHIRRAVTEKLIESAVEQWFRKDRGYKRNQILEQLDGWLMEHDVPTEHCITDIEVLIVSERREDLGFAFTMTVTFTDNNHNGTLFKTESRFYLKKD